MTAYLNTIVLVTGGFDPIHSGHISLFNEAKKEATKLTQGLAKILQTGIDNSEFRESIEPLKYARNFYAMIEGAVFMAMMYEDKNYLVDAMDLMDEIINNQIKKV